VETIMSRAVLAFVTVLAAGVLVAGEVATSPGLPATPRTPVVDQYWGVKVTDDYRWLERWSDPAVREWSNRQNAVTRAALDALPGRAAIAQRVEALVRGASVAYGGLIRRGGVLFAIRFDPARQQPQVVTLASPDDPASARVVVDPNVLDPTGHTSVDFIEPSRDGTLLAVSLSHGGSESGDVHVFVVATGKQAFETVPRVNGGTAGGSVAWSGDGSGFYYTRYPRAGERPPADVDFYQQVYHHVLGTPVEKDAYCIGREFPRIAETRLDGSDDGATVLAQVANGDGGEFAFYLRRDGGPWVQVAAFADRVVGAAFAPDSSLLLISHQGATRGRVLRLPAGETKLAAATVIVPESDGVIEGIVPAATRLYLTELVGGPSRVRSVALDGTQAVTLPVPEASSVWQVVRDRGDAVLLDVESYLTPGAWYRWAPGGGALGRTGLVKTSVADFSDCEALRETATSKDGTKVPLTVVRRRGTKLDGANPTLLEGYGGFNLASRPSFSDSRRLWLEQGGVVAIANLRGGNEFGEAWHEAGRLTRKQNVFDDFIACARFLVAAGYATPKTLAIEGGSNGGLLMGAALTQAPELFRVVITHVGIYDMLRNELTPNGTFNITEYGTVKDRAQFAALYAYSPYHHVQDGARYPAVLFLTGANDPRVDPMNSRKMVARLQAATASGLPVLLRTSGTTGHGGGTPVSERIVQLTDVYAFLFHELGVAYRPVGGPAGR
jgi:prolyl oligopeptidase